MQALCDSTRSLWTVRPNGKRLCSAPMKIDRPRSAAYGHRNAPHAGTPSSVLLESLNADKDFGEHLKALRSFDFIVDMHMMLQEMVNQQSPLQLAPTAVSNENGVLLVHSKGEGPLKQATLRVQTLNGPEPIDWAHHTFAIAPGFAYSKSSVYTSDGSLLPHLELEMGTGGDGSKVLLYINMDPRLSLTVNGHYLDYFYNTAPPTSSTGSRSDGNSVSWMEIEAKAAQTPGFTRFTSPSLHVRACSASAILFYVESTEQGRAAAQQILQEAANCWLAWLASGAMDLSGDNPEAFKKVIGAQLPENPEQQQAMLKELAVRSTAWRRFAWREKMAGALIATFGEQAMEDYWDSMAGAARIRRDK